jgi:hypothetical protein
MVFLQGRRRFSHRQRGDPPPQPFHDICRAMRQGAAALPLGGDFARQHLHMADSPVTGKDLQARGHCGLSGSEILVGWPEGPVLGVRMTRSLIASCAGLVLAALSAPVMAHGSHHHAPVAHSSHGALANPCLLGSGAPGQCMGPVQVTRSVVVGPVTSPGSLEPIGPIQPIAPVAMAAIPAAPVHPAPGCTPASTAGMVRCEGNWVPVQPVAPAPVHAPVMMPAPMPVAAPVPVAGIAPGSLPLSFFVGGATNGVGFNTYPVYGGGFGGVVIQGGGTRFSGVRERAPWPLVPPARQPRHYSRGGGCGGCHH